jgi:hypothetical protein
MAVVLAAAASSSHAAAPVQRKFSDWTVVCDNGLRCVAQTGDDNGQRALQIERDPGPDAPAWLEMTGPVADLVDDRPVRYPAPAWWSNDDEGVAGRGTQDLAAMQRFIDTVRNGSRLRAKDDEESPGLSLDGLSAALLFIDDAQGRLGTRGALLRRGDKPESAVPAAPRLPVLQAASTPRGLSDADARRLVAQVRRLQAPALAKADCDEPPPSDADQAWPLTNDDALVHLGCWMGAYQGSGLLFRVPRTQPAKAVRVLLPAMPGEPPRDVVTNADYAPATAQLSHYAKGRGLGDCGEIASWTFDGRDFVLAELTSMDLCNGVNSDRWPTLWRSRDTSTEKTP